MLGYKFVDQLVDHDKYLGIISEEINPANISVVVKKDNVIKMT